MTELMLISFLFSIGNPLSVSVSFVLYQTDGLFDSPNVSRMLTPGISGEYVTSGRVISSTIEGVQLMNLSEPVVVEFTPHQVKSEARIHKSMYFE